MKVSFNFTTFILLFLQLHSLVNSQAPTSGCNVISDTKRCISHFTTGVDWQGARDRCLAWGGDLATVTSLEEYNLMYSLNSAYANCWIGLNDLDTEGLWVWADGSNSTYRYWGPGQPDNHGGGQDCGCTWIHRIMDDCNCEWTFHCYFCTTVVEPFGEQISANTFIALESNSLLYKDTTLYCITENENTPHVTWTYKDLAGVTTVLPSTTDVMTGISTTYVTRNKIGFYSCEVSQKGGEIRTFTTLMLEPNQASPVLSVDYGCGNTFSLLPPAVNRADIPILTQNVILSTNLVGRWQTPDGSYVNSDSITIPTLYVSHAGLYKFYVTNWNGEWILAIQIEISPIETYTQTIVDLNAETLSHSSMRVTWSLKESNPYDSGGTFSVFVGLGELEILVGTTKERFFEISGLVSNFNYKVRVELQYPHSDLIISATTQHLLSLSGTTIGQLNNTGTQSIHSGIPTEIPTNTGLNISYTMYTLIAVLVIFVAILILLLLICLLILCVMKRRRTNRVNSRGKPIPLPQVHTNELYQQNNTTQPMSPNVFSCSESVEPSKQTKVVFDLSVPIPDYSDSAANNYALSN